MVCIILIISLLHYNSRDILVTFMTPISINSISYINELDRPLFIDFNSVKSEIFREYNNKEIIDFLNKLEEDKDYILEIRFIPNISL